MSLINQMLRDLESRNANNTPSTLQHTVQATQTPASKFPLLVGSLLAIIAAGGSFWAYQLTKKVMITETPQAIVADKIRINPVPIASYEQVLAVPNALTSPLPNIEQQSPESPITHSAEPKPIPAASTIAAVKKTRPEPVKPLSAKQQANVLYVHEENTIDESSTIHKLEQVLKLDPRHLKARILLAKALHNQGQANKTAEFLDQSLSLFPENMQFINTRAQLFLKQNNPDAALKVLQRIDISNSSNETYLSLLAASYQQQQSFTNAAKVYQRLVTVNPEKAENWLGLALSQEKIGNINYAREAYQQALKKNTLKESIISYINQRLAEL